MSTNVQDILCIENWQNTEIETAFNGTQKKSYLHSLAKKRITHLRNYPLVHSPWRKGGHNMMFQYSHPSFFSYFWCLEIPTLFFLFFDSKFPPISRQTIYEMWTLNIWNRGQRTKKRAIRTHLQKFDHPITFSSQRFNRATARPKRQLEMSHSPIITDIIFCFWHPPTLSSRFLVRDGKGVM